MPHFLDNIVIGAIFLKIRLVWQGLTFNAESYLNAMLLMDFFVRV